MKAVISYNPHARFTGESEQIETIDITSILEILNTLNNLSKHILGQPDHHCDMANFMASLIREARIAITPYVPPGLSDAM